MPNLLSDTIALITPFCRYQAANIGVGNQPIVGIASIVRSIMLSAPFQWRFNRNTNSAITTEAGTQDYQLTLTDFGYLETGTVSDGTTIWDIQTIKNDEPMSVSKTKDRPSLIAVQNETAAGIYTFRFSAVPDAAYQVGLIYQKSPVVFTSPTDAWAPIPDSFADVYNNFCLGYYMDSCQDSRAPQYIARGIAGLLARAEGLDQMDKAIFAASYMNFASQEMLNSLRVQQGQQAKAAR